MTPDDLGRDDIIELLDAVAAVLRSRGEQAVVYVVGGAAIALREVSSRRRTADVDALMVPEHLVLSAAAEVARQRGLRADWLNSRARPWIPPLPMPLRPPATAGLDIRTADEHHLLAMKLVAARGLRDMVDAVDLARHLGLHTADALLATVIGAYGEDAVEDLHGGVEDMRLTCDAVVRYLTRE